MDCLDEMSKLTERVDYLLVIPLMRKSSIGFQHNQLTIMG